MKYFFILFLGLSCGSFTFAQDDGRPNILILFLDDLDPDFGCYGNDLVHTPNIDKLANEGMRFTRAFSAATVCSPSHTTLFTGCYASTLGCPHHRSSYIDKLPQGYFTLTDLMRDAGYFNVNFKSNGDRMYNKIYGATAKTDLNFDRGKPENNQESGKEVFDHLHIIDPMKTSTYFTGGAWEEKKDGQPFFAYANIETGKKHGFEPGRIWAREHGIQVDSTKVDITPFYSDNGEVRHILAAALDAVSHTDVEVGKFLEALEKAGLKDSTLVILASDHGATLPRHKQCLWYTGIHIPMIIRWPGNVKPGVVNTELASIIDIAPTILAAAQTKTPKTMEGLNLFSKSPKSRKYLFATRDGMNNIFDCSRAVIGEKYFYIQHYYPELPFRGNYYAQKVLTFPSMISEYQSGNLNKLQSIYFNPHKNGNELYLFSAGEFQTHNLANNPNYKRPLTTMQLVLNKWEQSTGYKRLDAHKLLHVSSVPVGTKVDDLINLTTTNKTD